MAMARYLQSNGGSQRGKPHQNPPAVCDVCKEPITTTFYDTRLPAYGQWGNLCGNCFKEQGCSLGLGLGQQYIRELDSSDHLES